MTRMAHGRPRFPISEEEIRRVFERFYREGTDLPVIGAQIAWEFEHYGDAILDTVIEYWVQIIVHDNIAFEPSMALPVSSIKSRTEDTEYWIKGAFAIMREELTPLQVASWETLMNGRLTQKLKNMRPGV